MGFIIEGCAYRDEEKNAQANGCFSFATSVKVQGEK
jgi:hypothetical protein